MARIRTIKPEFFTSEDIVSLSPFARLLYIALWCEADREGRFAWKPNTFKMRYLPGDTLDIDALARELVASGLVKLYSDGLAYIPEFAKHQHVNPREAASILPSPNETKKKGRVSDASARDSDTSARDSDTQVGKEGKGKEGDSGASKTRKTSIPENFQISERVKVWAESKGHKNLQAHFESFYGKCKAKSYQYVDWDEAFMNAIRDDWAKLKPANGAETPRTRKPL